MAAALYTVKACRTVMRSDYGGDGHLPLKPFVSRTFPLQETPAALTLMMQRKVTGKLVVTTGRR